MSVQYLHLGAATSKCFPSASFTSKTSKCFPSASFTSNVLARPLVRRPSHGYGKENALGSSSSMQLMASPLSPFYLFLSQKLLPAVASASPKFYMRVASGSRQAYICRDCGYIYNDRTPFEKLPDKYFCPVCGAPKRRFRPYQSAVAKDANATDVRKARKEQIKRDESLGQALPYAIVIGIIALVGLYFYLNNTF